MKITKTRVGIGKWKIILFFGERVSAFYPVHCRYLLLLLLLLLLLFLLPTSKHLLSRPLTLNERNNTIQIKLSDLIRLAK
jgi:hypothetical protein